VTERFTTNLDSLARGASRLAIVDRASKIVRPIPAFRAAKHLSPQISANGGFVTFLADPDGITNVYRMAIDGGPILRVTAVSTGVAGITSGSPALSMASGTGRLAYSVFEDDGHSIYVLDEADVVAHVAPEGSGQAALLPGRAVATGDVQRLIGDTGRGLPALTTRVESVPYSHALKLDGIGQPTVTAGVSEFGGFVSGSVSAFFSDMLGDRMLGLMAQAGGSFADLGGQAVYVNRRHRWNWGAVAQQLPFRVGVQSLAVDPAANQILLTEHTLRQTNTGVYGVAAYPFSGSTRVEVMSGVRWLSYQEEARVRVYSQDTQQLLERRPLERTTFPRLRLAESNIALVRDTSFFGATSPVFGSRARIEIAQSLGSLQYTGVLLDARRYFMPTRPVTVAIRGLHYGRYGQDSEHEQLVPLYAGHQEFVHGYASFSAAECPRDVSTLQCPVFANLLGSRLLVANLEVRAPLAGLASGEIEYGRVPVEVAAFFDAGVTWSRDTRPSFLGGTKHVVRSVGGAARVNLFGLLVIEIAASRPFDRVARNWQWQVGLRQGF
jgi:hypothetical protein